MKGYCRRCRATYELVVSIKGMDKIGIKTIADWARMNMVLVTPRGFDVTCWQCCHEAGIGAEPTHGRGWKN